MHILHTVPATQSSCGGIGRDAAALAAALIEHGDHATVVPSPHNDAGGMDAIGHIRIEAARSDVVHIHGLWNPHNRIARTLGRRFVISPHGMMLPGEWKRGRWRKLLPGILYEHKNLRSASRLHALTAAEAGQMRALGFNERITIIPMGVNVSDFDALSPPAAVLERFPQLRQTRWVLFPGSIRQSRGIVPAMQACFDILARADGWHLVIAGPDEGGLVPMLQAAVSRKGLADRVTFTGLLSAQDARAAIGRADIVLLPSIMEYHSMSIIEALAAGRPVVISEACHMPQVAERGAGRIVPPVRQAIGAALRELVGLSDAQLGQIGQSARALAREQHDWPRLISQYQQMYAELT